MRIVSCTNPVYFVATPRERMLALMLQMNNHYQSSFHRPSTVQRERLFTPCLSLLVHLSSPNTIANSLSLSVDQTSGTIKQTSILLGGICTISFTVNIFFSKSSYINKDNILYGAPKPLQIIVMIYIISQKILNVFRSYQVFIQILIV